MYSCEVAERGCPAKSRTYYSWLVIDDARESDAYTQFVFSASAYVYQPYPIPTRVTNEFHLNLIPGEFHFPPPPHTHKLANIIYYVINT